MISLKKLFRWRILVNIVVAGLFVLVYFVSARVLAEVQVIGEVKMQGLSQLGTQVFRVTCLIGAGMSLFSFRASSLFTGLALGILLHMGIGVYQDVQDLAEYYPNVESVTNSIKLTIWGKTLLLSMSLLILLGLSIELTAVCMALTFSKKIELNS